MKQEKKEQGIILVEAIIAIGVLVTVFTATMALYMSSIEGVRLTDDQVTATYLAQDAMEVLVGKRLYNYEHSSVFGWLDGIVNCTQSNPCSVDFSQDLANPLPNCGGTCNPLYINSNDTYNALGTGFASRFTREMYVTPISGMAASSTRATVRVSWRDGADIFEYTLHHTLYDNPN